MTMLDVMRELNDAAMLVIGVAIFFAGVGVGIFLGLRGAERENSNDRSTPY